MTKVVTGGIRFKTWWGDDENFEKILKSIPREMVQTLHKHMVGSAVAQW